jgi:predicted nucleotidyltransferase
MNRDKDYKRNIYNTLSERMIKVLEMGYNVLFTSLIGSQNYLLDDENSDIDCMVIVVPKLKNLIFEKPINFIHELPNNEQIQIIDVRLYCDYLEKQKHNILETLFSDYILIAQSFVGEWETLREYRNQISNYDKYAIFGGIVGNIHQFCDRYRKTGNNKYAMHVLRFYGILIKIGYGASFEETVVAHETDNEFLTQVKNKHYSSEIINAIVQATDVYSKEFQKIYMETHDNNKEATVPSILKNVIESSIRKNLMKEIEDS